MQTNFHEFSPPIKYLFWCNDTRAIRTNQSGLALPGQSMLDLNHILLRNTLSDANDQGNFSLHGFHNSGSSSRRRNINDRSISLCFFHSFSNGVENWQIQMSCASFSGTNSTNHIGTIFNGLFGVKRSLFASEPLADNLGFLGQDHVLVGLGIAGASAGGRPCWKISKYLFSEKTREMAALISKTTVDHFVLTIILVGLTGDTLH